MTVKTNNTKKKKENVDNFNKKIANYLKKEFELIKNEEELFKVKDKTANYQNNLYKIKHDITKKIEDNLTDFVIFSHMFEACFISSYRKSEGSKIREYEIPENQKQDSISQNIYDPSILDLIDFNIMDEKDSKNIRLEFLENHREITKKIFSVEKLNLVLDSIFQYNQPLIYYKKLNPNNIYPVFNFEIEKVEINYFSDISKLLISQGVKQITKHLHPTKEKNIIHQLQYFSELVNRLEIPDKYSLEEIEKELERIRKENKN